MTDVTWVLEHEVFPDGHARLQQAAQEAGHRVVAWEDQWWSTGRWPRLTAGAAIFHGSLGNAARVREELPWRPGAFCATARFRCSAWYPAVSDWLLHPNWVLTTVADLVTGPEAVLAPLGSPERVFVRPDSPLKPFSGRVLAVSDLSLRALDHGFYYDDQSLPVVAAPVCKIEKEWRYVVCRAEVVAGSAYDAARRASTEDTPGGAPWAFAAQVARAVPAPEELFVMDICLSPDGLRLLELNPFSGADLYGCDRKAVVAAAATLVAAP